MRKDRPETKFIELRNGKEIAYCEYGDLSGKAVFYFHGTPGSRYEALHAHQAGVMFGQRIIALDRPGIGRSEYSPARSLLDWPQTVLEVAQTLGIERFGVIGVSGGGAYALACAARISANLDFAVAMGSWAPVSEEPQLWKMMAPLDSFFGKLSRSMPWVFYIPFSFLGYAAKWLSPQAFIKSLESSLAEDDKKLLGDRVFAEFLAEDTKEAFRQGVRGPADDAILLYRNWGFRMEEIEMDVHLFHGREDKFAPYPFAEYLNRAIPDSELHDYPGRGHLFLIQMFEDVFKVVNDITC